VPRPPPGVDTGWASTWTDSTKRLQLSGATGGTFNVGNTATNNQNGDEFHFERAADLHQLLGKTPFVLNVRRYMEGTLRF
jgi:hypothetical protein